MVSQRKALPMHLNSRTLAAFAAFVLSLAGCGSSDSASSNSDSPPQQVSVDTTPEVPITDSSTGFLSVGSDSFPAAVRAHLQDSMMAVELAIRRADTVWRLRFKVKAGIASTPVGSADSSYVLKIKIGTGSSADTTTCLASSGTVLVTGWIPQDSSSTAVARFTGWGIARMLPGSNPLRCPGPCRFSTQEAWVLAGP